MDLEKEWVLAKEQEEYYKGVRLDVENRIAASITLPEKGTTKLPGGLKIVTKLTEKWDQDKLNNIQLTLFPFKAEWKLDRKTFTVLEEHYPDEYKKLCAEALTLTPAKPSFSFKGGDDD